MKETLPAGMTYVKIVDACGNCKERPAEPPHTCTLRYELHNDDETLCDCCDNCARECAEDV